MKYILWGILALFVFLILFRILLRLGILLFVRTALRRGLADVGQKAVAQQPARIHLRPDPAHAWSNPATVQELAAALVPLGFVDAGTFCVPEMTGMYNDWRAKKGVSAEEVARHIQVKQDASGK